MDMDADNLQGQDDMVFSDLDSMDGSSSDDEDAAHQTLLQQMLMMIGRALIAYVSMLECFQSIEMTRESQSTILHHLPANDVLGRTIQNPPHFKELTSFTVDEFHEFCAHVCPIIQANARTTGTRHIVSGRPCKLSAEQRVLAYVMYTKHDNIIYLDASIWNWARSALCDDSIFIASCVNEALGHEISWPDEDERRLLGTRIPQLPGCIGFVDGTLVRVRRPFQNPDHKKWFQGRKKMYCMNSTVVVDHDGLFRFVDGGYPGSYHDVTILKHSWMEGNWRQLFKNVPGYCEFLLGDSGYTGMEKFVMRGFSKTEIRTLHLPAGPVKLFNQMHSGYRVRVEWGIGGLKQKWRRMMKRFDLHRPKFATSFKACAIMTNFIHRRRMDMRAQFEGPREVRRENRGWAGDY